ncbi:putative peptidoglycan endopeptidase LytE [Lentibacillus populi]|uniref:Peptidoglycan endopeptidase LytE n=1 Tax=Lentibacillus populi TaxID=1827502 RepID=A0A9W5U1D9_9BACI|nr:peptidoglycan endopeptidase [Lentibacillus populi]GGB57999.1 putative peptidoglycan endopeptidase LytE [Lentibacillus populi]
MANKKIMMSVTASAVIASAFLAAEEADAASYKVKSGDSLWVIAQKYNTTVSHLKSVNNLTSDIIFPNQVLETGSKKNSSNSSNKQSSNKSATYTVKSGDTLSGIAFKHNISLSNLMKWNNLKTTLIYPGDVFVVSKNGASSSSSGSSNSSGSGSGSSGSSNSSTYTVRSGDTLSGIAIKYNVTVTNLKKRNGLKSDLIIVGQKLKIGANGSSGSGAGNGSSSSGGSAADIDYNVNKLISTAKSLQGIHYVWGGSTPSGFDCSGFIYYTYNKAGKSIGRLSSGGYYNRSYYVNKPAVGDLVFFENTYQSGISHLGIYLGNNQFISAESDGVKINSLSNSYWSKHFEGFKRFY